MATTIFKTIRCTPEELAAWKKSSGGNLNGWIRAALNSQMELDAALERLETAESGLSDNLDPHG